MDAKTNVNNILLNNKRYWTVFNLSLIHIYTWHCLPSPAASKCLGVNQEAGDFAKVTFSYWKSCHRLRWINRTEHHKNRRWNLLKTLNDQHSSKLLKLQQIRDIEVDVVPHTTLITIKIGTVQEPTEIFRVRNCNWARPVRPYRI